MHTLSTTDPRSSTTHTHAQNRDYEALRKLSPLLLLPTTTSYLYPLRIHKAMPRPARISQREACARKVTQHRRAKLVLAMPVDASVLWRSLTATRRPQ